MFEKIKHSPNLVISALSAFCLIVALAVGFLYAPYNVPLPPPLRITESSSGSLRHLEVPIVSYADGSRFPRGLRVDFIGAVHMGERSYYADLNTRFREYDSVLFELVSDGTDLPTPGAKRASSILGSIQRALADLLGLSFQLDEIDYQARNFVHADLSPQRLRLAMQARGESLLHLLIKIIQLSQEPEFIRTLKEKGYERSSLEDINPLLIILRGPTVGEQLKIKRFMAQGLVGSEAALKILEGEKGSALITDRNQEAVAVLKREIAAGKRSIAIFYGVGHLPDMHKQLTEQVGLRIVGIDWLKAWRM